jgi:putative tricarboxylic transport membrane protein
MKPRSVVSRSRRWSIALFVTVGLAVMGCGVSGGGSGSDSGKDYPSKAVELTVPSDPGGSTDLIGRAFAKAAEKPLGQSVAVVNKPGANGKVGGKAVLSSTPDGYKIVLLPQSLYAIGPLLGDDPDAIQLDDMTLLSGLTVEDYVMVVPADSKYKTLKDVLADKDVKYGTTGAGTGSQLAQALLFGQAKVDATDVPLDGGGPLVTALLGSQVDVGTTQIAESARQIKAGKLRPLAVFSRKRLPAFPDVPTARESGYDIVVDQRRYLAAPKGLPKEVRSKLEESITSAVNDPGYRKFLKENYVGNWVVPPAEAEKTLNDNKAKYAALAKKYGVKLKGEG